MQCFKRPSSSSSSSSSAGNEDLLTQLLLFLPAKTLIRFQLVNKQWRSVISSPAFRHLHTLYHNRRRSNPSPYFLLRASGTEFYLCDPAVKKLVRFGFNFRTVHVLQSCNGLLLLECRNSYKPNCGRKDYYVFNPTTMQSRRLVLPKKFCGLCLVFDPSKSPHYKVFCFVNYALYTTRMIVVYDSETHTWAEGFKSDIGRNNFWDGFYWKGGIYFLKYHQSSRGFCLDDQRVFTFDKPWRSRRLAYEKSLTIESNGHLYYIYMAWSSDECRFFMYELSDVDFRWSMRYCVDLSSVLGAFSGVKGGDIGLVGVIRGEKEEDSMLVFYVRGKIMVYRLVAKVFEVLVDFGSEVKEKYFESAHQFIESLAPV